MGHRGRGIWIGVAAATAALVFALPAGAGGADPLASQQWAIAAIGASPARGDGDAVTVAVVGGGVADHPDLPATSHWVCVSVGGEPAGCAAGASGSPSPAATHAAGVVAARLGNGQGITGIAPAARLLDLRVTEGGVARPQDIDAAIARAAELGASVAVVVLPDAVGSAMAGGTDAVGRAVGAGMLVVGGVGSAGHVPDAQDAVAVAAVDRSGRPAGGAPTRARWALAAPGGTVTGDPDRAVLGTAADGGYVALSGTWVAAAHVAAAAAVLRADGLDAPSAAQRLVDAASPASSGAGPGRLDLEAARSSARATASTVPPSPTTAPPRPVPPPATAAAWVPPGPQPEIDAPPGILRYRSGAALPVTTFGPTRPVAVAGADRAGSARLTPVQVGTSIALAACGAGLAALVRAARRPPMANP